MHKKILIVLFGLFFVGLFTGHVLQFYTLPLIKRLELTAYDTRLQYTAPYTTDSRVAIIDIDENSLREKEFGGEGRWPWPRDRLAKLIDQLITRYDVSLVALDILLAERDESSGINTLEFLAANTLRNDNAFQASLAQLRPILDHDTTLSNVLRKGQVVLGYSFFNDPASIEHTAGALPSPVLIKDSFATPPQAHSYNSAIGILPKLQQAAASAGHLNPIRDIDGVTRRVALLVEHAGGYYESLSLAVVRQLTGETQLKVAMVDYASGQQAEFIQVGDIQVPVDAQLNTLIPYRGNAKSFAYYSALDVISGSIPLDALKNRIVLIGTSAHGLSDMHATPLNPVYPGVEIHANLITGLLDGKVPHQPSYLIGAELIQLIILGLLLSIALPKMRPVSGIALTTACLIAVITINMIIYQQLQLAMPLATTLACLTCIFICNMAYGFFIESRGARQIANLFGQYVPPELVEQMAKEPSHYSMAPLARELTVLFSDVRDFTHISESLAPQDLAKYINEYLTGMSLIIREGHHGTLDKYIGDAIMAFWGAPVTDTQHARNAVNAALKMQAATITISEKVKQLGWPPFKIGIGINTGIMRVGDMGSQIRRAYTVMGDAVNLSSRLEGLTKTYGVGILIGEQTRIQVPEIICREVDKVRVKGKDQPIAIFEPIANEISVEQTNLLTQWHAALQSYRLQEWDKSQRILEELLILDTDTKLYAYYLDRIAVYRIKPPPIDWDGVTKFETK